MRPYFMRGGGNTNVQERYIEKKVTDYAVKKLGWLARKLQWGGRTSAPDHFYARLGKIVLVEFKQFGKKPTEKQAIEHEKLRNAGVEVYVIDSVDAGYDLFDRLTRAQSNYEYI